MTGASRLVRQLARRLRYRQLCRYAIYAAPVAVIASFVAFYRSLLDTPIAVLMGVGVFALQWLVTIVWRWPRRVTALRVARHLDRRFPALQESATLLLSTGRVTPLQRLQQQRVGDTLITLGEREALEAPFNGALVRPLAAALLLIAVAMNLVWLPAWLQNTMAPASGETALVSVSSIAIDVQPPDYTRLPSRVSRTPDVQVAEFSNLRFTMAVSGAPSTVVVESADGQRIALYRAADGRWQSDWWPSVVTTYQVLADDHAIATREGQRVHRIAQTRDQPPAVTIAAPDNRLHTVADPKAAPLDVTLQVADDYGIAAVSVEVIRSTGDGEQVEFEQRLSSWYRDPDATQTQVPLRRLLDPSQLGLAEDSELYLRFSARDARPGVANRSVSQTLIVRWSGEPRAPSVVLDNTLIEVLPVYFRSQRQLIMDSERLIGERLRIDDAQFRQRAQALAVDQKALRLRYGQFMGEEDSGGEGNASDHFAGDGHDHAEDALPTAGNDITDAFGDPQAAISPYAHFHDQAEQATLFDPQTRGLLAEALSAMWSAERALGQHAVAASLPEQYQALALIKRVQDRSRVFVERVGFEPTPVDPQRRLSGVLSDVAVSGRLASVGDVTSTDDIVISMQKLLGGGPGYERDAGRRVSQWLEQRSLHAAQRRDDLASAEVLAAQASLRQWRATGSCQACAEQVARFWRRHAPTQLDSAQRRRRAFDAFSEPAQ